MPIINRFAQFHPDMTAWRQDLHQNPQTAFEETYAAAFVAEKLRAWGIETHEGIAGTGVVGVLRNGTGKSIGLRADMDALDMMEENQFGHRSKTPGKMHGCGHDGHTATLLGTAQYLAETRNFAGTVNFIFQPAEEGRGGAEKMIEEGLFRRFPCDAVFGYHNWPSMPVGTVGLRTGPMLASSDLFTLKIIGVGGHAAQPHLTIDPILIGCQIVNAWQALVSRQTDPLACAVLSVTQFHGGMAHNVIPGSVELAGTVRAFDETVRTRLETNMLAVAHSLAGSFGAQIEFSYKRSIEPTINWLEESQFAATVAADVVGANNVHPEIAPVMGGEDFGAMLKETRGSYIFVGSEDAAHKAKLHNPHYDFNDEILPIAASYFARLVERFLPA